MISFIDQLLGYTNLANQALRVPMVNTPVDQFDSSTGVRHYLVRIFQILSLVLLVVMIYACTQEFLDYMKESHAGMEKIGSVLTYLVCIYACFPLAQLIRSRGESLGGAHHGMVSLLFNDVAKMGIRLIGELAAVILFFQTLCMLLAFAFKSPLFIHLDTTQALAGVTNLVGGLIAAVSGLIQSALGVVGMNMNVASMMTLQTASASGTTAAGEWTQSGFMLVIEGLVSVLVALITLYVVLAVYHFVYSLASTLLKWISSPSFPISIKNR